jgi:hypothetical protein
MTPTPAPRLCPLYGNPTAPAALLEAHLGPTSRQPRADVVVWLCPPCARAVTHPTRQRPAVGGWRR